MSRIILARLLLGDERFTDDDGGGVTLSAVTDPFVLHLIAI